MCADDTKYELRAFDNFVESTDFFESYFSEVIHQFELSTNDVSWQEKPEGCPFPKYCADTEPKSLDLLESVIVREPPIGLLILYMLEPEGHTGVAKNRYQIYMRSRLFQLICFASFDSCNFKTFGYSYRYKLLASFFLFM